MVRLCLPFIPVVYRQARGSCLTLSVIEHFSLLVLSFLRQAIFLIVAPVIPHSFYPRTLLCKQGVYQKTFWCTLIIPFYVLRTDFLNF